MVRRPDYRRSRESDLDATMTPMIDVVFLLLIFFVWTAGAQMIEYVLPSQLSQQQGNLDAATTPPPPQDFDNVVIRLRWEGGLADWTVNDQPMQSVQQVADTLTALAQVKLDAPIIVHPDSNVPLGYVIEVYDLARLAGFVQVSFAVNSSL